MKFATKPIDVTHLTLLQCVGKLKIQIFCRYSADMQENAKKCTCAPILIPLRVYLCMLSLFSLCVNRIFEVLSIRRHSYFLFTARSAASWPPVNCACVPQLFQQLISIMLCPAFFRTFVHKPVCCVYPFKYKLFYQNLVLVAEHHFHC